MSSNNVERLETGILGDINVVYKETAPTEEQFIHEANLFRSAYSFAPVTDEEFQGIINRLRQYIVIQMDVGISLEGPACGHQSWLPAKRADFDFFFWNRYKKYLEEVKHWTSRMTASLDKVSDEILDFCGDPSESSFAIKGLVLGDVQSGKTANYTALCNKAADTGYRMIIILAGMQENLRRQTQDRLDTECVGIDSSDYLNTEPGQGPKTTPVGVGRYGIQKKIVAFTSVTEDFNRVILRSNNLGIENVNCPVILVVKKNKLILNNLIKWLSDNNTLNYAGKIDLPLMLIDDEADNASINTRDAENPAVINDCIRRLLRLFTRTSYIGITATPFANIFIDPGNDDDLFPADFIYSLSAPSNYIGADRIFGDGGDYDFMLQRIDVSELERCFPPRHKKTFTVEELPYDLYEAAYYFLLVNAVRDYRGDVTEHRSMMVHISFYINVQNQIVELMNAWLQQVKSDLRNYAKLPLSDSEKIENIHALHTVWVKYNLETVSGAEWETLLQNYLFKAVAPIDVRAINTRNGAGSLDYARHKNDGLRIIAVGGNSLSRGLTLEGLCVTYFHRNSNMYDTLMQMGRWFGFRPNYDDLVKIWLSSDTIDWYGQITRSIDELKDEIAEMHNENKTPREFGLRVRQDPGSLIVTARNKMKTSETITCPITVSGHLLETPRLKSDKTILKENENAFKRFVYQLAENGVRLYNEERTKGNYYWEHVNSAAVAQLLMDFETNPWHLSFNGAALSEYISRNSWPKGWDVVLITGGTGPKYPAGIRCGEELLNISSTEKRAVKADDRMISVSGTKVRVGVGGCTQIGLTNKQIKEIRKDFLAHSDKKNVPDRAYLIKDRAPILMLHILQADYEESSKKDLPEFLFALGVGFPKAEEGKETTVAQYVINMVEVKNGVNPYYYEDYEDDSGVD